MNATTAPLEIQLYGELLTDEEAERLGAFVEDALSERDAIDAGVEVEMRTGPQGQVMATAPVFPSDDGVDHMPLERFLELARTTLLTGGQVSLVEASA